MKKLAFLLALLFFLQSFFIACNHKKDIYSKVQFTNVYKTQYLETPEGYNFDKTYVIDDKIYIIYTKTEDETVIWETSYEEVLGFRLVSNLWDMYFDEDYIYITIHPMNNNGIDWHSRILCVFTADGALVDFIHIDDHVNNPSNLNGINKTPDGNIILTYKPAQYSLTYEYYAVDINTKKVKEYEMPEIPSYEKIYCDASFSDAYDVYYGTGAGFYGYNAESKKSEQIINWNNSDIFA